MSTQKQAFSSSLFEQINDPALRATILADAEMLGCTPDEALEELLTTGDSLSAAGMLPDWTLDLTV